MFYFLLLLIACSGQSLAAAETMKFQDAVKRKIILCQLEGTDNGHWGACISMYVANPTANELRLAFDVGMVLEPDISVVQNMMITQQLFVTLPPFSRKTTQLYAMCIENNDLSPSKGVRFRPKEMASPALQEMGQMVAKLNVQRRCGQQAVWCISGSNDTSAISDDNKVMQQNLRMKTAGIWEKYGLRKQQVRNSRQVMEYESVRFPVVVKYELMKPTRVMIGMYNRQNELLEMFVSNEVQQAGIHQYKMEIGGVRKHSGSRYVRLFLDGEKKQEIELEND
jgi:hypothetical protein